MGTLWLVFDMRSILGDMYGGDISGLKGGWPCELADVVCMTSL